MYKLFNYLHRIDRVWLLIWSIIYCSFLIIQLITPPHFVGVTLIKYIGIILALIYCMLKFPKDYNLQLAFLFTLLADTILAIDSTSIYGVFVFCFAQFFHLTRLVQIQSDSRALFGYFAIVILVYAFGVTQHLPHMYIVAFIYGVTLLLNVILSLRWFMHTHTIPSACAWYGFLLFLACDINVGLSYLSVTGVLPHFITPYADYFAWVFYYPALVLLSNSSKLLQDKTQVDTI